MQDNLHNMHSTDSVSPDQSAHYPILHTFMQNHLGAVLLLSDLPGDMIVSGPLCDAATHQRMHRRWQLQLERSASWSHSQAVCCFFQGVLLRWMLLVRGSLVMGRLKLVLLVSVPDAPPLGPVVW